MVFRDDRPDDCETTYFEGERLLYCDGILYRPSYHRSERVYEIVDPENYEGGIEKAGEEKTEKAETTPASSSAPLVDNVSVGDTLKLQTPRMQGAWVVTVQKALQKQRYVIDDKDGIYGTGTNLAVKAFQIQKKLPVTGDVDTATAKALGL